MTWPSTRQCVKPFSKLRAKETNPIQTVWTTNVVWITNLRRKPNENLFKADLAVNGNESQSWYESILLLSFSPDSRWRSDESKQDNTARASGKILNWKLSNFTYFYSPRIHVYVDLEVQWKYTSTIRDKNKTTQLEVRTLDWKLSKFYSLLQPWNLRSRWCLMAQWKYYVQYVTKMSPKLTTASDKDNTDPKLPSGSDKDNTKPTRQRLPVGRWRSGGSGRAAGEAPIRW